MDGLARTAGVLHREIVVGGCVYRLGTPRLSDLAALEAELLARLPDPIEQAAMAARHLPPEAHAALFDAAYKAARASRRFSLDQIDLLPVTLRVSASAMVALRRYHGEEVRSLDDAVRWIDRASDEYSLEEIGRLCEAAAMETAKKKCQATNPPAET